MLREKDKVNDQKIKILLEKQLELLFEKLEKCTDISELSSISNIMASIASVILTC